MANGNVYYNEFDPGAAAWLRELVSAREIPAGDIDTRSISDVQPEDLSGYGQCHFFAGIGGWLLALRLAGVGPEVPVWTGSCPCQPFSPAGDQQGMDDKRHLWPEFFRLISQCRPPVIFGEQVAEAIKHGWLDELSTDMEAIDYAVAAAVLPAASRGSPTARHRLFWVAESQSEGRRWRQALEAGSRKEFGGSGEDVCPVSWPDGRGRGSTLTVADVLSPSHGIPGRVGLLRGYGNAIVPQVAAEFIQAWLETRAESA